MISKFMQNPINTFQVHYVTRVALTLTFEFEIRRPVYTHMLNDSVDRVDRSCFQFSGYNVVKTVNSILIGVPLGSRRFPPRAVSSHTQYLANLLLTLESPSQLYVYVQ